MPSFQAGTAWVQVNPSLDNFHKKIKAEASAIKGVTVPVTAQVDTSRLRSDLQAAARGTTATITANADTAKARADISGLQSHARRVDGERVNINVNAQDVTRAINLVGLLTAALAGVSAVGVPALAVLAAIPALGGAAVQGIGALAAGLSGVSGAVKALQDADTEAAAGTATSAASRVNSAQAIAGAQRQVEQAQIRADRAAITGAQQVADARRAVDDAYTNGARAVADAEKDLTRAQIDSRVAQEDVTRARAEAREEIEDLGRSLRGAALDEREAASRLADAQASLEAGRMEGAQGRDLERLEINAERAAIALETAQDRQGDLREESERATRVGVEGSDRVVAAQQRASDAAEQAGDAETKLAQARAQAARDVADAQQQLARTQQQALWAQQDAAAAVVDAQRALTSAYTDAGSAGSASADKVAEAFAHLSPEARQFARFLSGEVVPGLRGVRAEVQRTLLPRLETSLRNGAKLAPVFAAGLRDTGQVIGDLAVRGSDMMSSGPWQADFGTILAANNRIIGHFGGAALYAADSMRSITVAGQPMVARLAEATEHAAMMANQWVQTRRAGGDLDAFFDRAGDTLAELGDIAVQVVTGVINLTNALGPLGLVLLHTVGAVAEMVGNFAQAHPTITQIIATGFLAVAMFIKLGAAVGGLTKLLPAVIGGWQTLVGTIGKLGPTAIAQSVAMQRATAGMNAAALSAGVLTERFTGSAAAGEKVAVAGSKVTSVVTKIGSTLPVVGAVVVGVGLAWDGLVTSADEAAQAMLEGGVAAEQAAAKLEQQANAGWLPLIGVMRNFVATEDDATQAAKEHRDALGPLERAQLDAQQAAADYQLILRDFSPHSDEAKRAAQRLADAQDALERGQRGAADATKSHTDRILEQQGVMQGALSSDLAYREALERVNEQLSELADISKLSTEQSQQLEGSIIAAAEAAKRRALDNYTDKTSQDAVKDSTAAYNQTILDLVTTAGTIAPPALLAYITKLSDSELAAIGARVETDNFGNRVIALPNGKHIPITTTAPIAEAEVRSLQQALDDLPKTPIVDVLIRPRVKTATGQLVDPPPDFPLSVAPPRASGGPITGPGTATSDSILIRASDGEHMWAAAEVAGAGGHDAVERIRAMARAGTLPAFAEGGAIGRRSFFPRATGPSGATTATGLPQIADPVAAAKAFQLLRDVLADQLTPALLDAQVLTRVDTADAITALARVTEARASDMTGSWVGLDRGVRDSTTGMARWITELQLRHDGAWTDMRTRAGVEIGQIVGPQFGGLHAGLNAVGEHAGRTADWWGSQLGRIRALTADPIRWSLQAPINAGLVNAWNTIDQFFALGRPMGPVPIGFQSGGTVPGVGRGDKVPALLEPDEEVIPRDVARPHRQFLKALTAGQAEAVQAAGGRFAKFQLGGTVERVQAFARAQHGKPYIWGAVGPGGYDCSGLQSAATNVAIGRPPHQRLFTTASFAAGPVAGFIRGLNSAYGIGVFQGNPGHVAGTIGGLNFEAGGSPSMTKAGQTAAGATHPQFRQHFSLPQVGGRFIGGSGGASFDVGAYLDREFAATRRMIAEITQRFGGGNPPVMMVRFANDSVAGAMKAATSYDTGGWLPPGYSNVYNGTGGHELVLNTRQQRELTSGGGGEHKHYHLTVYTTNDRIDLETQFRRLEMRAGV